MTIKRIFRDLYTKETIVMQRNTKALDKAWKQAKEAK